MARDKAACPAGFGISLSTDPLGVGHAATHPDSSGDFVASTSHRSRDLSDWSPFYVDAASAGAILWGAGRSLGWSVLFKGCGNWCGTLASRRPVLLRPCLGSTQSGDDRRLLTGVMKTSAGARSYHLLPAAR